MLSRSPPRFAPPTTGSLPSAADGRPLGIGGRGPAWLLYDSGGGAVSEEEEARWVWSMFLITTE